MSGAELIVLVGIITNVISVINFCYRIVEDTIDTRKKTNDVPKVYRNLQVILPLVELTLRKACGRIEANELDQETARKLKPAIEKCQIRLEELADVFKRIKAAQNAWRIWAFFKSRSSLAQERKLNSLADEIMHDHVIIAHASGVTLTLQEIEKTIGKTGTRLDAKMEQHVSELKAKQPVQPCLPLKSANDSIQNVQTNFSNATVNSETQIYNLNVYSAQVVGVMNTETGPVPRVVEGVLPKLLDADRSANLALKKKTSQTPAVTALQFESPHLSGLPIKSKVPPIKLTDEPEITAHSTRLPPPHNPDEVIHAALFELREGAGGTIDYPGIAKQRYNNALKTLSLLPASSTDPILFRKAHLQTMSEIGLSQVELAHTSHIKKAIAYNNEAFAIAARTQDMAHKARATLDKGHIRAREARIDEKSGMATKAKIKGLRQQAIREYAAAVTDMRGKCRVMDEYDVLAQALMGSGRMSKKVGGSVRSSWGSGKQAKEKSPEANFEEAMEVIQEGVRVGEEMGEREEDREALRGIGEAVKGQIGVVEVD